MAYTGLYNADGQRQVQLVSGSTYVGLYSPDGQFQGVSNDGTSAYKGAYHPCGAYNVCIVTDPSSGTYAKNGSFNIIATGTGYAMVSASGITVPQGFTFPFNTYPIAFSGGSKFVSNFNARSYATAALAGTQYFVNGSTGSDANNGLTLGTAVKSIWQATTLGNAGGVPFNVSIAAIAGGYPRENGFSNNATPVPNTQPAAYQATGGVVENWSGSTLTWPGTPDPTFTNCYVAARSGVQKVIDTSATDVNGDYVEMIQVADATICNTTPNSWAQVTTNVYVHRTAGDAVTNANTRVLLQTALYFANATSKDVYLKGISFQGGTAGGVAMTAAATMNFMAEDCQCSFSGSSASGNNGWKLDFITGLVGLVRCVASCNEADGFNAHWTPGGTPGIFVYTQDCIGRNNGRDTQQSCNGLTSHDDIKSIDVNGIYFSNYGGNVVPINNCQLWCLGTYAHDSLGDIVHGGAIPPTDYNTQFTAKMWLQNCRSSGSTVSLNAANSSTIYIRAFNKGATQTNTGGGTITTF